MINTANLTILLNGEPLGFVKAIHIALHVGIMLPVVTVHFTKGAVRLEHPCPYFIKSWYDNVLELVSEVSASKESPEPLTKT